jgi:hypothetical protein
MFWVITVWIVYTYSEMLLPPNETIIQWKLNCSHFAQTIAEQSAQFFIECSNIHRNMHPRTSSSRSRTCRSKMRYRQIDVTWSTIRWLYTSNRSNNYSTKTCCYWSGLHRRRLLQRWWCKWRWCQWLTTIKTPCQDDAHRADLCISCCLLQLELQRTTRVLDYDSLSTALRKKIIYLFNTD